MYSIMLIIKNDPIVRTYFQNKSNFQSCHIAALFADQNHYYAVIAVENDTNTALTKLKSALSEYILIDDVSLAHGDERVSQKQLAYEYSLRVFPIYLLENVREFYTLITPEIAQYFLEANKLFIDHDFISAESKQLFVFTKKVAGATPANDAEGRQKFPAFYARLDKLVKDEIGGPSPLTLVFMHDHFIHAPDAMPHHHSTLFAIQPDVSTQNAAIQSTAPAHDLNEQDKSRPPCCPQ